MEQSNSIKSALSEELKSAIMNCFGAALRRSTYDVVEQFYTTEHLILFAQMLSVCVEIVSNESYRQLRLDWPYHVIEKKHVISCQEMFIPELLPSNV